MKALFVSLLFFISFNVFAKDTLDVTKDIPYLGTLGTQSQTLYNLNADSVHGDAGLLNAIGSYNYNYRNNALLILKFPQGVYRIDTTVFLGSNVRLVFTPYARVVSTTKLAYGANVFEMIGSSGVEFWNMQYTNYQVKFFNAVIQFKASPKICYNNKVMYCGFKNIWAQSGIMGAYCGDTDSTFWLDNWLIAYDTVINNFNPSNPHIAHDEYHTDIDCSGIDINNCYKHLQIYGCYILNTGGDGICGLGLSKAFSHDLEAGSAEIHHNFCKFNNMSIEINGTYLRNGLDIHDNWLYWPQYPGGDCISVNGRGLKVRNNHMYAADNGGMELAMMGGEVSGNEVYMVMWKDSTMGFHHRAFAPGSSRVGALDIYGQYADVHDNFFSADTAGRGTGSPDEYIGVTLRSPASNLDSTFERNSYGSLLVGISGGHKIHDNIFVGQTNRQLDNSLSQNQKIEFYNNTIDSKNLLTYDALFWIKGNNYIFRNNTINISLSAPPINGAGIFYKLPGYYGEVIEGNKVIGGAARVANNPNYKFIQQ